MTAPMNLPLQDLKDLPVQKDPQDPQGNQELEQQDHKDPQGSQECVPVNAKAFWFQVIILLLAMITISVSTVTNLLLLHYLCLLYTSPSPRDRS